MFQVGSLAAQTQPMNNKLPVGMLFCKLCLGALGEHSVTKKQSKLMPEV